MEDDLEGDLEQKKELVVLFDALLDIFIRDTFTII
jgi:hypothetical protein